MARKLRPDEFEARQRQLPASLKLNIGGKSLKRSRDDLARTPLGSPPVDYDVRSVYDVRPVGAFDFNIAASDVLGAGEGATSNVLTAEMTVPDGLVAVLRNFDIWFEPNPAGADKSDFKWSLQLNGADFPYNGSIPFGVVVDRETVFMLANEFNRIGIRVTATAGAIFVTGSPVLWVRFYGTFQIKGSIPLPFEIANPASGRVLGPRGPVRSPPVLPDPPPKPTGPALPAALVQQESRATTIIDPNVPPYPVQWRILPGASGAFTNSAGGRNAPRVPIAIPLRDGKELPKSEYTRYVTWLRAHVPAGTTLAPQ
jgi:hypothetical protein